MNIQAVQVLDKLHRLAKNGTKISWRQSQSQIKVNKFSIKKWFLKKTFSSHIDFIQWKIKSSMPIPKMVITKCFQHNWSGQFFHLTCIQYAMDHHLCCMPIHPGMLDWHAKMPSQKCCVSHLLMFSPHKLNNKIVKWYETFGWVQLFLISLLYSS